MTRFTADEYGSELAYLENYARDDWLGMSPITGSAASLLGRDYSPASERDLAMRIIADLIDRGADAGDITSDPEKPFVPWGLSRVESLQLIKGKWDAIGKSPESGEICWITFG